MAMPLIIFDDGRGHLGPMTDMRASFEVRTGVATTAGRIAGRWPKALAGYWVQPRLEALFRERANAPVNSLPGDEVVLCVNGRWAMPDDLELGVSEAAIEQATGDVIAARLRRADAAYFLRTGELHERCARKEFNERVLYRYPWDVIAMMKLTIAHDLGHVRFAGARIASDVATTIGNHPIEIHPMARVYPGVILDAEHGAIAIHEHAVVRPGAVLVGPCSIGAGSTVIDRTFIKANTVIGPMCKAAGEVGGTVFQGYSNKSHDGHLGDSWVGEWVNFGAGTTNSNLLNTYGEVTMRLEPTGPRQRTGLQFLGAIVGDHAKFAICTRIMTGTVVGTGAMVATSAPPPTAVARFAWLTDDGLRTYRWEKFLEVAKAVMDRRKVTMTAAYEQALRELHSSVAGLAPSKAP